MKEKIKIPRPLKIVAWLSIFFGILAIFEMLVSLSGSRPKINFGAIEFFIGRGLLRGSRTARWWAIFLTRLAVILLCIFIVLFLKDGGPPVFKLFGRKVAEIPAIFGLILLVLFLIFNIWELRVLYYKEVLAFFGIADGNGKQQNVSV